jgi:hypothetical protein
MKMAMAIGAGAVDMDEVKRMHVFALLFPLQIG